MSSGAPRAWGLSSALDAPASDRAEGLLRDLLLDSEVDWQIRPRRLLTSPGFQIHFVRKAVLKNVCYFVLNDV
jgi:hypothetical protein